MKQGGVFMEKATKDTQKTWTDSIAAGQPVSNFLTQINDNFEILNATLTDGLQILNTAKQNQIYIKSAKPGTTSSDEKININNQGEPTGGQPGDIVILYE